MLGDRWGVTDEEVSRPYPCDAWVTERAVSAWRGVTVATSATELWPWVAQLQVAPYSYDWLDNLGRRSPRELLGRPDPEVGDAFTAVGGKSCGRVLAVDPPHALTGRIAGVVISYVLVESRRPVSTRLLMKVVAEVSRPVGTLLCLGDLVMARRQLLNWKALAERAARPSPGA
jgi:hypothetical protein